MPTYRLKTDFPGVLAGELMDLDESNPENVVYRGRTSNLWMSKDTLELDTETFEKTGPIYYFVNTKTEVESAEDNGDVIHQDRLAAGNYFVVEKDAINAIPTVADAFSSAQALASQPAPAPPTKSPAT